MDVRMFFTHALTAGDKLEPTEECDLPNPTSSDNNTKDNHCEI